MSELPEPHYPNFPQGRSSRVVAELEAQSGRLRGQKWPIAKPVFVIGSAADCDLRIDDGNLAPYHAYIFVRDYVITFRHLGPPPVVTINGRMMRWGELQEADTMLLGQTELRVRIASQNGQGQNDLPWDGSELQLNGPHAQRFVFPE